PAHAPHAALRSAHLSLLVPCLVTFPIMCKRPSRYLVKRLLWRVDVRVVVRLLWRILQARKRDGHERAMPRRAGHTDARLVLAHDAAHHHQSQPHAPWLAALSRAHRHMDALGGHAH